MTLLALADGFGSAALGLAPGEDPVRAARHEVAALRPDVLVLDPAARTLPAACPPAGDDPAAWPDWVPPDVAAALRALADLVAAVAPACLVGVGLPSPWTLARQLTGAPLGASPDAEELVDLAAFAVVEAAAALAPAAVLLRETATPADAALAVDAWRPLARRLAHERRPLYVLLDGDADVAALAAGLDPAHVAGVVLAPPLPHATAPVPVLALLRPGDEPVAGDGGTAVAVDATSDPEAVQALIARVNR